MPGRLLRYYLRYGLNVLFCSVEKESPFLAVYVELNSIIYLTIPYVKYRLTRSPVLINDKFECSLPYILEMMQNKFLIEHTCHLQWTSTYKTNIFQPRYQ